MKVSRAGIHYGEDKVIPWTDPTWEPSGWKRAFDPTYLGPVAFAAAAVTLNGPGMAAAILAMEGYRNTRVIGGEHAVDAADVVEI